jgi:hypothetical protein
MKHIADRQRPDGPEACVTPVEIERMIHWHEHERARQDLIISQLRRAKVQALMVAESCRYIADRTDDTADWS